MLVISVVVVAGAGVAIVWADRLCRNGNLLASDRSDVSTTVSGMLLAAGGGSDGPVSLKDSQIRCCESDLVIGALLLSLYSSSGCARDDT